MQVNELLQLLLVSPSARLDMDASLTAYEAGFWHRASLNRQLKPWYTTYALYAIHAVDEEEKEGGHKGNSQDFL